MSDPKGTAIVTGATGGVGALYAAGLAERGYDLLLVGRQQKTLDALAKAVKQKANVKVETLVANLVSHNETVFQLRHTSSVSSSEIRPRYVRDTSEIRLRVLSAATRCLFHDLFCIEHSGAQLRGYPAPVTCRGAAYRCRVIIAGARNTVVSRLIRRGEKSKLSSPGITTSADAEGLRILVRLHELGMQGFPRRTRNITAAVKAHPLKYKKLLTHGELRDPAKSVIRGSAI